VGLGRRRQDVLHRHHRARLRARPPRPHSRLSLRCLQGRITRLRSTNLRLGSKEASCPRMRSNSSTSAVSTEGMGARQAPLFLLQDAPPWGGGSFHSVYTRTRTHARTYTRARAHTYIHTHTHTHMHTHTYTHTPAHDVVHDVAI
jgi:hypothetical protein